MTAITTETTTPILAAVDGSPESAAAVDAAIELGRELDAPVVFVSVRRGPSGALGEPFYQRRLTAEMATAVDAILPALAAAEKAGVEAEGEVLEGSPKRRIAEFARDRNARLVVVGSRRRRLGRSISRDLILSSEHPFVVAGRSLPEAA
jgi:nucleotide-binding universal stress UspA family protein